MNTLGKRIQAARTVLGITQAEMGARFGISRVAVSHWESDKTRPDHDKLVELADILKTTVGVLVGEPLDREAVTPPPDELSEAWKLLTKDEQAEILEQIKRRAAHNKAVMDELIQEKMPISDRRKR